MNKTDILSKIKTLELMQDLDYNSLSVDDKEKFKEYHKGYMTAIKTIISYFENYN